jgi:glycosyltransferase involved in cell wall biosynthesis
LVSPLKIGVVIPTLNEERNLPRVLEGLRRIGIRDVLVIDGRSIDKTVEVAKDFGVNIVAQEGYGKGDAVVQVFNNGYLPVDAIVMLDADGSMIPEEIPIYVDKLKSGFDIVKGSRFMKNGFSEDMSVFRRLGNLFFIFLVRFLWGVDYTDLCYGFAIFKKESISKLAPHLKSKNFEIETEVFIKAKKIGLTVAEVPSVELRRRHGKSNLKAFLDGFRILRTIIFELLSTD